jgi:hypothetical protein
MSEVGVCSDAIVLLAAMPALVAGICVSRVKACIETHRRQ